MERKDFAEICTKVLGDNVYFGLLKPEDIYVSMTGARLRLEGEGLTRLQNALGERVWVPSKIPEDGLEHALGEPMPCCPNCGAGMFGHYVWGLQHGECGCTQCYKLGFQAYHYEFKMQDIAGHKVPIVAFELAWISNALLHEKGYKINVGE